MDFLKRWGHVIDVPLLSNPNFKMRQLIGMSFRKG